MLKRLATLFIAGLLCSLPSYAHHSPASHYDMDLMVSVKGVVTQFRLINPHARIYFDVAGDDGEVQKWLAEGNASGILKRHGWNRDFLKPGDVINISGNPAKDGSHKMDWKLIVLEDGTELRGGNTLAAERERQLDELETRRRSQEQ